jgi:hypothetical protein
VQGDSPCEREKKKNVHAVPLWLQAAEVLEMLEYASQAQLDNNYQRTIFMKDIAAPADYERAKMYFAGGHGGGLTGVIT